MDPGFDAATIHDHPMVSWLARNRSKPGRTGAETWVAHARHDWSVEHLESEREPIAEAGAEAFRSIVNGAPTPISIAAHRWRHALVDIAAGEPCLESRDGRFVAAGDWCLGPRIEAAWRSGSAAADRVLSRRGIAASSL